MKVHNLAYKCFVIEFDQTTTDEVIADTKKKFEEAFPAHKFLFIKLFDPLIIGYEELNLEKND